MRSCNNYSRNNNMCVWGCMFSRLVAGHLPTVSHLMPPLFLPYMVYVNLIIRIHVCVFLPYMVMVYSTYMCVWIISSTFRMCVCVCVIDVMCTHKVHVHTHTHTHTHTTDADVPQSSVNSTSSQNDSCPNIDDNQIPGLHLYLPKQEVREGGRERGREGGNGTNC